MRGLRLPWGAACLGLCVAVSAHAADSRSFDINHLQLSTTGGDFVATESAGQIRPWSFRVGLALRYTDSPLVLERAGVVETLVESRTMLHIGGSMQFIKWIGLGVEIPVLVQGNGPAVSSGAAFGDVRLVPRIDVYDKGSLGVAILLGLKLPTGDVTRFLGEGMPVFEPRLAIAGHLKRVHLGGNVGFRFRQPREYQGLVVGQQMYAALAVAVVPIKWVDVVGELHLTTALDSHFGQRDVSPVEALVGAGGRFFGVRVGVAASFGLVDGFGAPAYRILATVDYRRSVKGERRPPPPPPPPVVVKPVPAPPLPDIDDKVEFAIDIDIPERPEPDVIVTKGRVALSEPILFDTNFKRIRSRYYDELDQLARVINARKEWKTIWIEGHADQTGPAAWNMELSRRRAEQVASYLIKRGVDGWRLKPVGYGEARPFIPKKGSEEKNRAVLFFTDSDEPVKPEGKPVSETPARSKVAGENAPDPEEQQTQVKP